ncbi:hypothetical protein VNI00_016964 [Paramarasmius palmivorus]|uniref:Uncharacterized protein n=1 Tax=Paramarasmius palmivorus TaxID=297713 RepID=A0AAW0BB87_9AGAR
MQPWVLSLNVLLLHPSERIIKHPLEHTTPQNFTDQYDTSNRDGNITNNGSVVFFNIAGRAESSGPAPPHDANETRPYRLPILSPRSNDEMSHGQRYTQLMLAAREGHPLWRPEPSLKPPHAHAQDGIRIGDVGIIDDNEPFDFLFNITVPSEHPINAPYGAPDGFEKIEESSLEFGEESRDVDEHVSGPMRSWSKTPMEDSRLNHGRHQFSSSRPETALLMLPEGSATRYLRSRRPFVDLASSNWQSWFDFAKHRRGRVFEREESLYLVTRHEKCSAWGMATLFNSGRTVVTLPFSSQVEGSGTDRKRMYKWGYRQDCQSKAHPRNATVEVTQHKNQTVFIRGYTISKKWWGKPDITDETVSVATTEGYLTRMWNFGSRILGYSSSASMRTNSYRYSGTEASGLQASQTILFQEFPPANKPLHPSNVINDFLHAVAAAATNTKDWQGIAISHDDDWISAIGQSTPLSSWNIVEFLQEVSRNVVLKIDEDHRVIYTDSLPEKMKNLQGVIKRSPDVIYVRVELSSDID